MSPEPADHPTPDQWIAYHRGELPAGEEERLQEHLARCRECFDLAAAAAAFVQPEEEPRAEQEMETAALWRLLRPQLDPSLRNVREISAGRPSWRFRLPSALAASFLVALVGMTAWNLRQRSALEALRTPQPNTPILEIFAGERDSTTEQIVASGPRMLVFQPDEDLPVYRLAILDAASGRELSSHELRPNRDFVLTLYLPELRPGRYRLELSDGAGRVLETHLLRVSEEERGE